MKTFITTLSNTIKAVRLLSNPHVGAYLQSQLQKDAAEPRTQEDHETLGIHDAFYHKHYIVQIVN